MDISFRKACIATEEVETAVSKLISYRKQIASLPIGNYEEKESSLLLPLDEAILREAKKVVDSCITEPLKTVVVVGIGGSSRGVEAVVKLAQKETTTPECIVLDELNAEKASATIAKVLTHSRSSEFLIIVVSKSGKTIEPLAHIEAIYSALISRFPDVHARILTISTEHSPLTKEARERGMHSHIFPEAISGRFSIFSPVGLIPLYALGYDVDAFLEGAKESLSTISLPPHEDPAVIHAAFLAHAYSKGVQTHEVYLLNKKMVALGAWYQQLLAESTGKNSVGITPILSTPGDFHATLGLSLEGPPNKTTCFLSYTDNSVEPLKVPDARIFKTASEGIRGNIGDIHCLLWESVQETYEHHNRTSMSIVLRDRSLREIGAYMSYAMVHTAYTAHLLGVPAFTQNAIDEYKDTARKKMNV
jgi:glucose-6-phosphate isomerase